MLDSNMPILSPFSGNLQKLFYILFTEHIKYPIIAAKLIR